jgi:hypothetical protein
MIDQDFLKKGGHDLEGVQGEAQEKVHCDPWPFLMSEDSLQ